MADLFDPAEFLVLPGTNGGVATTRATLGPCPCKCVQFEVVEDARTGRVALRCVECFAKSRTPVRVLGWVDMATGKTTEAPCNGQ
jgi:hypothetical protein